MLGRAPAASATPKTTSAAGIKRATGKATASGKIPYCFIVAATSLGSPVLPKPAATHTTASAHLSATKADAVMRRRSATRSLPELRGQTGRASPQAGEGGGRDAHHSQTSTLPPVDCATNIVPGLWLVKRRLPLNSAVGHRDRRGASRAAHNGDGPKLLVGLDRGERLTMSGGAGRHELLRTTRESCTASVRRPSRGRTRGGSDHQVRAGSARIVSRTVVKSFCQG